MEAHLGQMEVVEDSQEVHQEGHRMVPLALLLEAHREEVHHWTWQDQGQAAN